MGPHKVVDREPRPQNCWYIQITEEDDNTEIIPVNTKNLKRFYRRPQWMDTEHMVTEEDTLFIEQRDHLDPLDIDIDTDSSPAFTPDATDMVVDSTPLEQLIMDARQGTSRAMDSYIPEVGDTVSVIWNKNNELRPYKGIIRAVDTEKKEAYVDYKFSEMEKSKTRLRQTFPSTLPVTLINSATSGADSGEGDVSANQESLPRRL